MYTCKFCVSFALLLYSKLWFEEDEENFYGMNSCPNLYKCVFWTKRNLYLSKAC